MADTAKKSLKAHPNLSVPLVSVPMLYIISTKYYIIL